MFFGQTKITPIEIGIVKTDREFKLSWLLYLQEIKAIGQYSITALASYLEVSHAETMRIVNELERRGLVETSYSEPRLNSITAMASYLEVSHAETTRIVNELESRGLVKTSHSEPRKIMVKCTEAGLHYVRTAANALASSI